MTDHQPTNPDHDAGYRESRHGELFESAVDRIMAPTGDALWQLFENNGPDLLLAYLDDRAKFLVSHDGIEILVDAKAVAADES